MRILLGYLLSFLLFLVFVQGSYDYSEVRLEDYCDQTVYLSCPDSSSNRAGTLYFLAVPLENCSVSVQTVGDCSANHAIYFNIRRSELAMGDFLEVYENVQSGSNGTLIKRIPGGASPRSPQPSSVAQLLTSYNTQQKLRFHLNIEPETAREYSHDVHFDYTIVRQTSRSDEGHCRALSGYMPNEIICLDRLSSWRVHCPAAYAPAVGITNRASGLQTCTLSTTTTRAARWTTTRSWNLRTTTRSWTQQRINPSGYSTFTTTQPYEQSALYGHIDRTFAELRSLGIAGVLLMVVIGVLLIAVLVMFILRLAGKGFRSIPLNCFERKPKNGGTSSDGHPPWSANSALKIAVSQRFRIKTNRKHGTG